MKGETRRSRERERKAGAFVDTSGVGVSNTC